MGRVVVVGSINVDLVAYAERLPRPGETVLGAGFERHPGGKGSNQAIAAARAGAEVAMVGAVGQDEHGDFMLGTLADFQVGAEAVERAAAPTGVALIGVGGGENQIIVVPGANHAIDLRRIEQMMVGPDDVCLAQLETSPQVVAAAFVRARAMGATVIFNPAPALPEGAALIPLADVVVLNQTECAAFAGVGPDDVRIAAAGLCLRPDQALVLTLGAAGIAALWNGHATVLPAHPVEAVDATGAGDCFCGFLAAGIARGETPEDALKLANAAAALSVARRGAASSLPTFWEAQSLLEAN
jgi:ribokinase